MNQDDNKTTEKEFDQFVRSFGEKMPPKVKENVLKEIRRKNFEKSMEEKKESPEKDEPDMEL